MRLGTSRRCRPHTAVIGVDICDELVLQRVSVGEHNSTALTEPGAKADAPRPRPRSHYMRYLGVVIAVFALLSILPVALLTWFGFLTGAILLPEEMGAAQNGDPSIVAEPFSLRYWAALKIPRIAREQPEIVLVGSSRGMELRSAMFAPYKFYNASLTAWTLDQEITMIDLIMQVSKPRIIILGVDYFMFTNRYVDAMARERTMIFGNGWRYRFRSCANLAREFWKRPALVGELFEDWRRGNVPVKSGAVTLLGLDAIRGPTGFRFDGSMLLPRGSYAQARNLIAANEGTHSRGEWRPLHRQAPIRSVATAGSDRPRARRYAYRRPMADLQSDRRRPR